VSEQNDAVATVEQWEPTLPEKEVDDATVKASPLFRRIKEASQFSGPGGKLMQLSDEQVLPIARETWQEAFEARQRSRFSASIITLRDDIRKDGYEGNEWICRVRTLDDGTEVGEWKPLRKGGKRTRFRHEDYAELVGYGEDPNSDLGKLAKHGGFVIRKTQMKNASKNGTYEFVLEPGQEGNEVCDSFVAKLYQYPDDGAHLPVIIFPPKSGDKKKCQVDDQVVEVGSMSQVMKASKLQGAQTPAIVFDLAERLKGLRDDDETDEGEKEPEDAEASVADLLEEEDE
jgi:hypothetical protein